MTRLKMIFLSFIIIVLFTGTLGCAKFGIGSKPAPPVGVGAVVPTGVVANMSAKPPLFGVQAANDLYRSLAVSTGIDGATDGAVSARYSSVLNNLSATGGTSTSGTAKQSETDLAAQFAISRITADAGKTLSDPTRLVPIVLTTGFTASDGLDTFNPSVQTALAKALVTNLTGLPPSDLEIASLVKTMQSLRPLMTNDAKGKQMLVVMIATIILSANSWHS